MFRYMPKLILTGSFDHDLDWAPATIVDDPDLLRKCASSRVVDEWGEIKPRKNASLIHLIGLGAHEFTGPNRNGDTFTAEFLKEAHPTFIKYGALYRNHKNKDYSKREGDIEKTAFNDDMGRVELLVSANHDKCADWLSEIEKGKRVDFSMGFDCFAPWTKIKTLRGTVSIEDVIVGDLVLTHTGRFMPVERVLPSLRGSRKVLEIKMQTNGEPLPATEDHQLLVVPRSQVRKNDRVRWPDHLDRMIPQWTEARYVSEGDYLLRPVIPLTGTSEIESDVAYMLGQYLGDGCISKDTDNSVAITTHVRDTDLLGRMVSICLRQQWDFSVDYLNYDRELYRKKEATVLRIREPEFARLCEQYCGRLKEKKLSPVVWDLNRESAMNLLGGYVDADGCYSAGAGTIRTCSVLDDLNETIQQLFFSCGIVATTWKDRFGDKPGGFANRSEYANVLFVNKSDAWKLNGYSCKVESGESVRAQECIFFKRDDATYLACPISSVTEASEQPDTVFCLTVTSDHSFVAEGAVVHNCEYDVCSICKNKAPTRKQYCKHVKKASKDSEFGMGKILPDGRKCFVFNPKGVFNDMSKVGTGADMIAQHLRKVANLGDDEDTIIGGAELMEVMFPDVPLEKFAAKIAIAEKLSQMEKIIPVSGIRHDKKDEEICEKTAAKLRDMPAGKMFGELAKIGCLLPLRDLFCLVMGDKFAEIEEFVDEAEKVAHLAFSHAVSRDQTLRDICSNKTFECEKVASSSLDTDEAESLFLSFGTDYDLAEERLLKRAMTGSRRLEICSLSEVSLPAIKLLEEYAAYKLAALEAGLMDPGEDMIRLAASIN